MTAVLLEFRDDGYMYLSRQYLCGLWEYEKKSGISQAEYSVIVSGLSMQDCKSRVTVDFCHSG